MAIRAFTPLTKANSERAIPMISHCRKFQGSVWIGAVELGAISSFALLISLYANINME